MSAAPAPFRTLAEAQQQHLRDRERIAALEAELDDARGQLQLLQEGLAEQWMAPVEFCLTANEGRVLGALLSRDATITKPAIMEIVYANQSVDHQPEIKIVDVFICKLRKKLKPYALEVETVWGQGYRLTATSRAALLAWHAPPKVGAVA